MPGDSDLPIIDYSTPRPQSGWINLRTFVNPIEAQCLVNALEERSIPCQMFGDATRAMLSMYGAIANMDVQIHSDDLERANAVIAEILEAGRNDLEPVTSEDVATPLEVAGEEGATVRWIGVHACESALAMRETAMALQAARIEVRLPELAPRGLAPARTGARFVIRVREDDADRAVSLLRRAEGDEEAGDDPHCPQCGSWNVHEITHELKNIFLGLVGKSKPQQCECLKCHYIAERSEFVR